MLYDGYVDGEFKHKINTYTCIQKYQYASKIKVQIYIYIYSLFKLNHHNTLGSVQVKPQYINHVNIQRKGAQLKAIPTNTLGGNHSSTS